MAGRCCRVEGERRDVAAGMLVIDVLSGARGRVSRQPSLSVIAGGGYESSTDGSADVSLLPALQHTPASLAPLTDPYHVPESGHVPAFPHPCTLSELAALALSLAPSGHFSPTAVPFLDRHYPHHHLPPSLHPRPTPLYPSVQIHLLFCVVVTVAASFLFH